MGRGKPFLHEAIAELLRDDSESIEWNESTREDLRPPVPADVGTWRYQMCIEIAFDERSASGASPQLRVIVQQ